MGGRTTINEIIIGWFECVGFARVGCDDGEDRVDDGGDGEEKKDERHE